MCPGGKGEKKNGRDREKLMAGLIGRGRFGAVHEIRRDVFGRREKADD